jgi:hypothetical protein
VLFRVPKPLFCLVLLLAWRCLGPTDVVRADFVLRMSANDAGSGDAGDNGWKAPSSPELPVRPRQEPANGPGLQPGSATGGVPSGPSSGAGGLACLPIPVLPYLQDLGTGILFLNDERFKPLFASRLFRPPR